MPLQFDRTAYNDACVGNFRNKSVYHRKYHIQNVLKKIDISEENKEKIMIIFEIIDEFFPKANKDRKRIIPLNYIVKKILDLCGVEEVPPSTKSLKK